MEKTIFKRITAFTAALMVITGAAASCSKKSETEKGVSKNSQKLMNAAYRAVEVETDISNVRSIKRLSDGSVLVTAIADGNSQPTFYITDDNFAETKEIKYDLGEKLESDTYVSASVAPDGDIFMMATFEDAGDMEKPNYDDPNFDYEKFDFEEYYNNIKYTYKLYVVDIDGNVKTSGEISGLDKYISEDDGNAGVGDLQAIGSGKALMTIYNEDSTTVIVNSDGKIEDELGLDVDYIMGIAPLSDGTVALSGYFGTKDAVKFVDTSTMKETGSEIELDNMSMMSGPGSIFEGTGDYKLFMNSNSALYGLKEDGTSEEIINWVDSDMGEGGVEGLLPLDNGEYIVSYNDYSNGDGMMSGSKLYRLTKRDASELENMKVITVGVMYDAYAMSSKISEFNKSHEGVRFKMVDFSKYDEYDEESRTAINTGASQLKKDIIAGNAPDIIVTNDAGLVAGLQNKGLFCDLYEFLDKDSDLSKEDFLENVLKCGEYDGKLYSITDSFSIETYVGKSKFVDKENWTLDDLIEKYNNLPDGKRLTEMDYKEQILSLLLYNSTDFVDYKNGVCHFDDPEFKKLVEFCDKFPSMEGTIDWENPEDQEMLMEMFSDDNIVNDKILITSMWIGNFRSYTEDLKGRFKGEDITFVGFPSNDGKGALISPNQSFSILRNSDDTQLCWEFVKSFFSKEDDDSNTYRYSSGLSSLKVKFDKAAEESTKKPTYKDPNGKEIEEDLTYYDSKSQKEIKIQPLTNEEKDRIVEYIKSADRCAGSFDPDVEAIVQEEITAYLKGEKKSDEIIGNIQNRVSLLVSEQS